MKIYHTSLSVLVYWIVNIISALAQLPILQNFPVQDITQNNQLKQFGAGKSQHSGPECILNKDVGNGKEKIERFYFDSASRSCKRFFYKGNNGNLNNFNTIENCNARCICHQPKDRGQGNSDIPSYFYNKEEKMCQWFTYRGNGGNDNRFLSKADCQSICEISDKRNNCRKRPSVGVNCNNNSTIKYYYDKNCNCCRQFTYLGCEGNGNRFRTEQICEQKCVETTGITPPPTVPPKPEICFYQHLYGNCDGLFTRYYFDNMEGRCIPFTYSGCGGNENNFLNLKMCKETCEKKNTPVLVGLATMTPVQV